MATASGPYIIPAARVASSSLVAIGYDQTRKVLAITFKSGDIFHYASVPPELVREFLTAESKGRYYTLHIKGKFPGQKMTGRCPKCGDGPGVIGLTCEDCGTAAYADAPRERQAS